MTNQFNPAFPVVKATSFHHAVAAKPNAKSLVLAIGLSIILALGIGVTGYQLASQSVNQEIAQMHLGGTSISPALQEQLLLILVGATGVTALLVGAIALLAHRRLLHSPTPTSENAQSFLAEAMQTQLLADFTSRLRQSLDEKDIFTTSVEEIRNILESDRVLIYRFHADGETGEITAQAVASNCTPVQAEELHQVFQEDNCQRYKNGSIWVTHDVYEDNLTPDHAKILEGIEIKASLVAPIQSGDRLVGLLCVHQCCQRRDWQPSELYLIKQLATQIGFAVDQANLVMQLNIISQQQQQQTESLGNQLLGWINDVEEAAKGDLTVRADITETDLGTVADFFNTVIEGLRRIVTEVKQATAQVHTSLGENEGAIRELAGVAGKQAQETSRTLEAIEQLSLSIQEVAGSAHYAAEVARTVSATAEASTKAMEGTVEKIMSLRETVTETVNRAKHLGESSQQISKVVSLINQIALQTNLLAVNAGIEAAKTGEESHNFGVVAIEVGDLAVRSAAATQEIEQILENILIETSQVVEAMELGTHQVIESTHLVEDTKQSLAQILEVSRQIDRSVAFISAATVSQVEKSLAVTNLMKEMAEVSERTSKSSEQISSSFQQTIAIAQQLQSAVGVFKVDDPNVKK